MVSSLSVRVTIISKGIFGRPSSGMDSVNLLVVGLSVDNLSSGLFDETSSNSGSGFGGGGYTLSIGVFTSKEEGVDGTLST